MGTETRPDVDLEELLDNEIPCGGWTFLAGNPHTCCDNPATLRSRGHGCKPNSPGKVKCMSCWQKWYVGMWEVNRRNGGYNRCIGCKQKFPTPEAFSDYRPF